MLNISNLTTESRNGATMHLDNMSIDEFLSVMNAEDSKVAQAVKQELPVIRKVVIAAVNAFRQKGRLIYIGAGTSGRLGVLDAAECIPTFGTPPGMVRCVIAGGQKAIQSAVEGAEDNELLAKVDLSQLQIGPRDMIIGISASGRTPYVISGLKYAKKHGAMTASISCNKRAVMSRFADLSIEVDVGPEVLTGSTRLKAGTAQKMMLNMISTAAMIGIGKVYKNLMVDVQPTNEKLIERSKRIIAEAAEIDLLLAEQYYKKANGHVKKAIVMALLKCDLPTAEKKLAKSSGVVRSALY
ncbi:N-acetylmuramic acid 6-phosphate etherase [Domibacillus sp. A3M-37]|uniref:N-acetylmuramic acid 6-phosphate etherase n=1 Tax=Domibacillus TaxID=1433999 RepID=UPI0020B78B4D|nr:N-acetylmuramic acid 6-phosphate etherase [Domibacillus sp. A3M-37]MCP3762994.1 N-acetylmuramic acid 6-phosphate etherase [Domibacillus sp. A3M-37]